MAAKPLTNEAIALTEKKMGMTLDDIIKMSMKNIAKPPRKQRISNRSQNISSNFARDKSSRIGRVMDVKSALRQGVLAQRRSSFQANSFPLATHTARKAAAAPIRNGPINRSMMVNKPRSSSVQRRAASGSVFNEKQREEGEGHMRKQEGAQTLDSRFASMKTQKMTAEKKNVGRRNARRLPPWHRARIFGN